MINNISDIIVNNQYNIGQICTKRQCERGLSDKVALRWLDANLTPHDYTFAQLDAASDRCAAMLQSQGFLSGDVLFLFLPKHPELFIALLGALKLQLIVSVLFPNIGEEAIRERLEDSHATGIVTCPLYLRKLAAASKGLPKQRIFLAGDAAATLPEGMLSFDELLAGQAETPFSVAISPPETPSLLHYTSGSTGRPKGVLHTHGGILHQHATTIDILGLTAADRYWCTADQGWITGTTYGVIGPWSAGVTVLHYEGGYNAEQWLTILEREQVTTWYTAPTALRMLMREPPELFRGHSLETLRTIFSVGEPLNPEVIAWARDMLGKQIYDTWFQTETGAIMISNRPGLEVKSGSMGKPVNGIKAAILDDAGTSLPPNRQGQLCLKAGWPSMFVTYLHNAEAYQGKFRDGYYQTGDMAWQDIDGYFWFVGRTDDVINTAGHLVSPFEIESALLELPEVAESAAVGVPDELLYEKVVAYVCLHREIEHTPQLELKIRLHVAKRVASIATPQEVQFVERIPKNRSGKIMRRVLRARYQGLSEGDLSTLEDL